MDGTWHASSPRRPRATKSSSAIKSKNETCAKRKNSSTTNLKAVLVAYWLWLLRIWCQIFNSARSPSSVILKLFFLKSTNYFNLCGKKLKITAQCQSYAFLHGKYESGRVWIKYKTTLKFDIVWTKVFRRKWNMKNEINLILNCAIVFVVALFFCIINYYNFFARKMMTRRGDKIALSLAAFIFFPAL